MVKLSTVSEFISCLPPPELGQEPPVYRGQANAAWRVDCSAVRRFDASSPTVPAIVGHVLVGYLADLLNGASRYVGSYPELSPGCSELDILAQLQHQGAATGLIDFTLSPVVALWFACNQQLDEDGAVYVLSRSHTRETDEAEVRRRGVLDYFYRSERDWQEYPYVWTPRAAAASRSARQQSVFVLGVSFIRPFRLQKAVVDKNAKEAILNELEADHGVTEEELFSDLPGYARMNSVSRPFDAVRAIQFWINRTERFTGKIEKSQAHVDCGMAYSALGQHDEAVAQYSIALDLDPKNIGAHCNRGTERLGAGNPSGALDDYTTAIRLATESGAGNMEIAKIYHSRSMAHNNLGQIEERWEDLKTARDMGLDFYYNERGERGPRLDPVPEQTENYTMFPPEEAGNPSTK